MGKPKIRFKGFDNDWEQRKLGEIYGSIGNAFVGTATPYYVEQGHFYLESNNVKDGQINHNSEIFINDEFYEKQKDKWLHTGDMVMVQSGHVGHAAVISEELDNTAAHALIMFRNSKEKIEPYFLNYEYQTDKAKKKIENITTGNTIKHILASDMQEFVVDVPKYEEQKVIAGYFSALDHLITLHQRKCEDTKKLKKYMLQKMFPQNGSKVPEIRFKGFTDDWEQRKFSDIAETRRGLTYKPTNIVDNGIRVLRSSNINEDTFVYGNDDVFVDENVVNIPCVQNGDILITSANGSSRLVGKHAIIRNLHDNSAVHGGFMLIASSSNSEFLNASMGSQWYSEFLSLYVAGGNGAIGNLNKNDLDMQVVFVPRAAEQCQIGTYFRTLDHLITLHQNKCDELKKIKKYMLQNMFV